MDPLNVKTLTRAAVLVVGLFPLLAGASEAQERPGPVAEFAAGTLLFADDGVVSEGFGGGALRFYVRPRISVGPEIAFISGQNHSHLMVTGNVTIDALRSTSGRPRRATPFAVVGAGLFRSRDPFPVGTFTHNEGAFTAGGGVRIRAEDRVTIGVEARLGWELHIRLNAMVGVRFGKL